MQDKNKRITRLVGRILLTLLLGWLVTMAALEAVQAYRTLSNDFEAFPMMLGAVFAFFLAVSAFALILIWKPTCLARLSTLRQKSKGLRWLLAVLFALGISALFLHTLHGSVMTGVWLRGFIFGGALLLAAWLLTDDAHILSIDGVLRGAVVLGSAFTLMNEFKTAVAYPFSLGWSEGNRMWDYSTLFGRHLYDYPAGIKLPAYIDLGRQSLWGLPFLLPQPSILLVRAWSAFLYTIPCAILGWMLFRHKGTRRSTWLLLGLWSMLFLYQGPIYTPLILAAMLVVIASALPWWLGAILTGVAGYYAYISRSTWVFAPAMWGALIAFLQVEPPGVKSPKQRWGRAIAIGLGGLTGGLVVSKIVDMLEAIARGKSTAGAGISISGISNMVTRQPLLWERLWPNTTYAPGIVLGLLMASGALGVLLILLARHLPKRLDGWQKLLAWAEVLAFLVVGIIVSVKIGGGSNLHNVDMFLITLLILAALFWKNGAVVWLREAKHTRLVVQGLLLLAVLYPASQGMFSATPLLLPSHSEAMEAVENIQLAVNEHKEGEVLFIDQRQLLTFGFIEKLPLVGPQYEKKRMMDQAMADNEKFFAPFYEDLRAHRFSLIVSEPLRVNYQTVTYEGGFSHENNAWVNWVSVPILCLYEPIETNETFAYQLLIPRVGELPEKLQDLCTPYR